MSEYMSIFKLIPFIVPELYALRNKKKKMEKILKIDCRMGS